ncbi:DAK2 domain-containing protein [Mycoplasma nasistruthionis]|uniref:DAK2 domain-containing protein n=1 Tax=Mycoplasma nasistruthionis TaxID=353852 RepID=A0A4Y6I721_9MOLU|nr:DAK2 domain-containing protein [Mycoplasma nasistruthionis]QDF65037.1 DAK2 domain-containing protein [Mycoplasma nasistruthionis]
MNKDFILNGQKLAKALISGANALLNAKNKIDALNVFPVPDGDTGTNMSATMAVTVNNLAKNENASVEKITADLAHDMLFEARGNSGVILSQIFKGFALGCKGLKELNTVGLLSAFKNATERAYKSVFKPVEGTILTVIRETTENLVKEFKNQEVSYLTFFAKALEFMRKACDETPNKLKTLREVGVTDSGGEGLYIIFWGINEALNDRFVELKEQSDDDIETFISDGEVYDGEFGYCTEVLIDLNNPDTFDKNELSEKLLKVANSLVVVSDENICKVHGHAIHPGKLLNIAQEYGEFIKIKSENMTLQANNSKANAEKFEQAKQNTKRTPCGIVSCNLGSGIINRMKELGCDYVVESGQTQNPSAQDLINAVNSVNADTVFILTNNSNIILVAQQVAQVINDKNVVVIPTKSQMQGITAMLNFNHESTAEENQEMIEESIQEVTTGEITLAIRDTTINKVKVKSGQYLAILDNKIISAKDDLLETAKFLIKKAIKPGKELVSIYYGDESDLAEAQELENYINATYDIEVEVVEGNQPTYHFIIGVE